MTLRRPGTRGFRGVVLLGGLLLAGCGAGPISADPPSPTTVEADGCRALVDSLPDELAGEDRREVTDGDGLVAAWGDPAIVLRCGVDSPDGFTRASTCVVANDTGWFVPDEVLNSGDAGADVTMTAVDVRPRVEVFLPGGYRPDGFLATTGTLGLLLSEQLERERRCR